MSLPEDPVETTNSDLDALRRRMSTDDRFLYRRHDLFTTVFTTPLTIDMVLGEQTDTLRAIVNAVRDLHGHDVEIVFDTDGADVAFCILKWRNEAHLRSLDSQIASVL